MAAGEQQDGQGKKKKKFRIGCLGGFLLFLILAIFIPAFFAQFKVCGPPAGDRKKVIQDIYRYQQKYGAWPESLAALKAKLPDHQFGYRYGYGSNNAMFIVSYQGTGFLCDDTGEFYRSDSNEWKTIYGNWRELDELYKRLRRSSNP